MSYEKAIEKKSKCIQLTVNGAVGFFPKEFVEKAVEKQIPKKPDFIKFEKATKSTTIAYCPSCGNSFGDLKPVPCIFITMQLSAYNNHEATACNCCGQALDWSEQK